MNTDSSSKLPLFMAKLVILLLLIILITGLSTTITYYLLQKEQNKIISQLEMYRRNKEILVISPTPTEGLDPVTKPSPMKPQGDMTNIVNLKEIAKKELFKEYPSGKITITYYGDVSSANRDLLDQAFTYYWESRSAQGPGVSIIKLDGNYAMGKSFAGGGYQHWFAVKSDKWNFFDGEVIKDNKYAIVSCSFLDKYNFPLDFYISTKCS